MTVLSNTQHVTSGSAALGDIVIGGGVLVADLDDTTINAFISSGGVQSVIPAAADPPAAVNGDRLNGLRGGIVSDVTTGYRERSPADRHGRAAPPLAAASSSALRAVLDQPLQLIFQALSLIGIAIALLDCSCDVVAANQQFVELLPCVARKGPGRRLSDRVANRLIAEAMVQAGHGAQDASPSAMPLRGDDGKLVAVGHLVPINRVEDGPMTGVRAILIANRAGPREALSPLLLQRLFGLSPAEARVACGIVEGQTLSEMADTFGVSRETVRSQLKRVLAKSGVDRQVDLAALLGGLQV